MNDQKFHTIMHTRILISLISTLFLNNLSAQKVGIGTASPQYELDVNGFSASGNQVSVIPIRQSGALYTMSNTSGADLTNCESGLDPLIYNATGEIEVKLIVRIASSSAGTNNFQLRAHNGTTEFFPIVGTDSWTFASTQTGVVAVSPWKSWSAGFAALEIHLYGWVDAGSTNISSAYLLIRPKR